MLKLSDLCYQRLFESAQDGILIINSESGVIVEANPFLINLIGYSKEEIIGKKLWEIGLTKDIISSRESFLELLKNKYLRYEDLQLRKKDGSFCDIEFIPNICLIDNVEVTQCNIKDISDRKRAEKALTLSEKKYRYLFENNPLSMWIYDLKTLAFLEVNESAILHYGYKKNEFLNMTIKDIRPVEDEGALLDDVSKTTNVINHAGVWQHKKKNGEIIFVEIISHIIDYENRPARLVLAHDVTKLKMIDLQLEENVEKLKLMNATKDRFFSILAHDLRGAFSVLFGYSEFLYNDFDNLSLKDIKRYSTSIYETTNNSFKLFENLLEWSRMQMGRVSFQPKSIDVSEIATEIIQLNLSVAQNKDIKLESNFNGQFKVFADENMVRTILRNLLSNAIKFTNKEGTIKLTIETKADMVEIKVSDTGVGIANNNLNKLFRIDTNYTTIGTTKEKGTGLGLLLCKDLVEKCRGKIWVESELGKGTTSIFTLPAGI
ncbi:MAG: sensor histidine kinase [Ignavibacteriaceae bacterium]